MCITYKSGYVNEYFELNIGKETFVVFGSCIYN